MHPFGVLLFRILLGSLWVLAGIAKLSEKGDRGDAVAQFGLTSRPVSRLVGFALPGVELVLGLALLLGALLPVASAGSALLLLLFAGAIAVNLVRGRRFECHCFGSMGHALISWGAVIRNGVLALVSLGLALQPSAWLSADALNRVPRAGEPSPPAQDALPVLLLALGIGVFGFAAAQAAATASAIARSSWGPALNLPERRLLRRWMKG